MAQKIDRQKLQQYFIEALKGEKVILLDGLNPFHVEIDEKEYYIYIKNLSPAYFQNPDVWRVQLPIREEFDKIKESEVTFILLGYDADNDVYTTWNPVWTKQRLNNAESVSFYSRLSLQQDVKQSKEFKRLILNNDGEVIAFPREFLKLFFATYSGLFQSVGDYVAIGSKKRPEANDAYKRFTDLANIPHFAKYMNDKLYSTVTTNNYTHTIKTILNDGTISHSKRIFLSCNSLDEYLKALDSFFKIPQNQERNERTHNLLSAALRAYITFLTQTDAFSPTQRTEKSSESEKKVDIYALITDPVAIDGFEYYLGSGKAPNGKIYNRNTISHYIRRIHLLNDKGHFERHKDIFTRYGALNELLKSFNEFLACPEIEKMNIEAHHDYSAALKQYAYYLLLNKNMTNEFDSSLPGYLQRDGSTQIIQDSTPEIQYCQETEKDWETPFIDENGNLTRIANPVLIERLCPYLNTEYRELAAAYNEIEAFYGQRFEHMEMSAWNKLFNDIDWNNPYQLQNSEKQQQNDQHKRNKKSILRVEFPGGRIIQHSVASKTFAQVIDEHYPDLIAEIGIVHAGVPLVSKNLDFKYAKYQKQISGGWYVFTNIRTERKQADLQKISEELDLNLRVSVVDPDDGTVIIPAGHPYSHVTLPNKENRTCSKV